MTLPLLTLSKSKVPWGPDWEGHFVCQAGLTKAPGSFPVIFILSLGQVYYISA